MSVTWMFTHIGVVALLWLSAQPTGAATVRVPVGSRRQLARIVEAAQAGDTLLLAAGTHRVAQLRLPDGVTLRGEGSVTRLKGRGRRGMLWLDAAHQGVVLENLLLTGARNREVGGAIRALDSRLTLKSVTIEHCRSRKAGGALFARGGTLTLQEYDAKVKDIAMKIGGTYNITNKMNLDIRTKIPRKLLEQNAIGAAASSGFGLLQKEASKLGLNIKQGEFINVLINLTGDIQKPKVGLKLLGAEGEGSVADAAKGQVKEEAQKAIDEGKQLVKETTTKAVDSLKTVASQKAEQAKKELEEKARQEAQKAIGNVVDTATQKKAEELLEGAKKEGADKIKENLDKWNPFGKKKKDGGG